MNLRSLNLARQTLLMDGRNGWVYLQRIILALVAAFFLYTVEARSNAGSAGLYFFGSFYVALFFYLTIICISEFSICITKEREQGTLQLLQMTGISAFAFIAGRAGGKLVQLCGLFLVIIPATVFAVTLGGISLEEIVSHYILLSCWLFFVSSVSLWASVWFSSRKESLLLSVNCIIITFIILSLFSVSPISRSSAIFGNSKFMSFFWYDMLIYLVISALFIIHAVRNFKYTVYIPLSFLDDYEMRQILQAHKRGFRTIIRLNGHKRKRYFSYPISEKDLYFFPKKEVLRLDFNERPVFCILAIILFLSTLPFSIFFLVVGVVFYSLYLIWRRILDAFTSEVEGNTLGALLLLPFDSNEILERKMRPMKSYSGILKVFYSLCSTAVLFLSIFARHFVEDFFIILLITLALPALFYMFIYTTVLISLKVKELTVTTSLACNMLLVFLYFAFPLLIIPAYIGGAFLLKRKCIQALDEYAELS